MILALMNLTTVFGTFLRTENQAALQTSSEWFWNSDVDCGNLSTRFLYISVAIDGKTVTLWRMILG